MLNSKRCFKASTQIVKLKLLKLAKFHFATDAKMKPLYKMN
ncbi:hypothetical protein HMPREF9554_01781 [Treponema phagedenis F0421]|nr:hypothetical protein HMPREF9554_01781 [Treponema phagedenis F0421]